MSLKHLSFFIYVNVGLCFGSFDKHFITKCGNYYDYIFFYKILRNVYFTLYDRNG